MPDLRHQKAYARLFGDLREAREAIRIGMPSGILAVGAAVEQTGPNTWIAQRGSFFRTTRRLFDGRLYLQLS
jgi:2-methylaconitate cis-trans-isomerase PrpF